MYNYFEMIGNNILEVLNEKRESQQDLADKLGISKQMINKIIKGKKAINALEIKTIAKGLNTDIDRLLNENNNNQENNDSFIFNFMGKISKEETKEKIVLLEEIINEILFVEECLNEGE